MRDFAGLLRQRFVVIRAGSERVECEVKLIFPAEFKAGFRHGVIADLRTRVAFCEVCGMGRNFVGNQTLLNIIFIWQAKMFFWRDVTQHGAAEPADHGRTNS
ncbi:hypothetical protein D3C75_1156190 [compost metagenome]